MREFEKTKLYDLAMAAPLITYYVWTLWDMLPSLTERYYILRYGYAEAPLIAATVAQLGTLLLSAVLIALLLFRSVPRKKTDSILPRVAAVLGTFAALAFMKLQPAEISVTMSVVSSLLIFIGLLLTMFALFWLGRSFSIMPEARHLITSGPYALVRHPVYLFEEIAVVGVMLQYRQPAALFLLLVHIGLQIWRIHNEERVLRAAFPEYDAYAARTKRLIPGVY